MSLDRRLSRVSFFWIGWCFVACVGLLESLWLTQSRLQLPAPLFIFVNLITCLSCNITFRLLILGEVFVSPRKISFINRSLMGVEAILLYMSVCYVMCIFSYLTCALGYPLIDAHLMTLDKAIGFDWAQILQLSRIEPSFTILRMAYASIIYQFIFFIGWFALLKRKDILYEMFWILVITTVLTCVVSGFFPVLGPASMLGLESSLYEIQPVLKEALSDVIALRSGVEVNFDGDLRGIVGFPSFHTSCAVLLIYGFQKSKALNPIALTLNLIMLLSIPAFGNHYLMDMVAGFIVAVLSIAIVKIWIQRESSVGFVGEKVKV